MAQALTFEYDTALNLYCTVLYQSVIHIIMKIVFSTLHHNLPKLEGICKIYHISKAKSEAINYMQLLSNRS